MLLDFCPADWGKIEAPIKPTAPAGGNADVECLVDACDHGARQQAAVLCSLPIIVAHDRSVRGVAGRSPSRAG